MEQRFYFNDRINKAIDKIMEYPVTIVSAPIAFGKSISIEEAARRAKERGFMVEWSILQEDRKQHYAQEVLETLHQHMEEKWLYVFDECDGEEGIEFLLQQEKHCKEWNSNIHCICMMKHSVSIKEIHFSKIFHCITKDDLELHEKDIVKLYQLNGIKISYQSAGMLYEYSGGWPGVIMLGIREYFYKRKLVPGTGVDELIQKECLMTYSQEEEEAFFSLFGFEQMKLEQIRMLIGQKEEQQNQCIQKVVDRNPFIEYDMIQDTYIVKKVLYYYLKRRVKRLPFVVQRRIYLRRAKWFESQKQFFESIKIYAQLEEYEFIFQYPYRLSELCACMNQELLELLWKIMEKSSYALKCRYTRFPLLCASIFFLWNDERKGKVILDEVGEMMTYILQLSSRKEEQLQGEICLIRSIQYKKNLDMVYRSYERSLRLLRGTSTIYDNEVVWNRGNPSLIHLYYEQPGTLKQTIQKLKNCMELYYELTNDNARGSELMIEAEAYWLQCQFTKAKSVAYQGIKTAEKFGQTSIVVAGLFIMMRMALYLGDQEKVEQYRKEIESKVQNTYHIEIQLEKDLCMEYADLFTPKKGKMLEWKYEDYVTRIDCTEELANFLNVLYLKRAQAYKEEQEVIVFGHSMQEQAKKGKFLWAQVNIQMTMAVSYRRLGNEKQAITALRSALDLVIPDKIYLPIVLYYAEMVQVFEVLLHEEPYQTSVEEIMELYKEIREIRISKQQQEKGKHAYGLTNRELEIAILGAKRYSNSEIAKRLYISENTVKYNMKQIFQKMGIKSRLELKDLLKV